MKRSSPSREAKSATVSEASGRYEAFYAVVSKIPRGRVATYGEIARLAGFPGRARQVGYALHALADDSGVPWQRVVGSGGRIRARADPLGEDRQRAALERERVRFGPSGRIDMARFGWIQLGS